MVPPMQNSLYLYMRRMIHIYGILTFLGCTEHQEIGQEKYDGSTIRQSDPYEVQTTQARKEMLTYPIQAQGKVEARNHIPITFEVSGLLETIDVSNASYVRKGQVIASLQQDLPRIDVEEAKQNFEKVQVDFENRLASFGDSARNPKNWTIIKRNVGLLAGLPNAKIALARARFKLEKTVFRAPFSGLVEGLEAKEGQSVLAMQPIGHIIDHQSLEVLCRVLEFDLGKLGVGDSATIFPLAYSENAVKAIVREINPKVEQNGYVKVRLALDTQHHLLEGMSCRVEIYVPESEQILVPKSAVVKKSGKDVIFTVEGSLAKWNYVTLGKENGRQVEVLKGLKPDQQVIISNNLQLAHDSRVSVNTQNPAP